MTRWFTQQFNPSKCLWMYLPVCPIERASFLTSNMLYIGLNRDLNNYSLQHRLNQHVHRRHKSFTSNQSLRDHTQSVTWVTAVTNPRTAAQCVAELSSIPRTITTIALIAVSARHITCEVVCMWACWTINTPLVYASAQLSIEYSGIWPFSWSI